MVLLDTNIVIYSFQLHPQAVSLVKQDETALSSITAMELFEGAFKKDEAQKKALLEFFDLHEILPVTLRIALKASELIYHERAKRKIQLTHDYLIAATAIIHQLPLITANVKDFRRFQELQLIPFVP